MKRFDVYQVDPDATKQLVCIVQSEFVDGLNTKIVIPLLPRNLFKTVSKLNLTIMLNGQGYILATNEMAAIRHSDFHKKIGSLEAYHHEIISAIDFIFNGL